VVHDVGERELVVAVSELGVAQTLQRERVQGQI
jgi:hypothetical protein